MALRAVDAIRRSYIGVRGAIPKPVTRSQWKTASSRADRGKQRAFGDSYYVPVQWNAALQGIQSMEQIIFGSIGVVVVIANYLWRRRYHPDNIGDPIEFALEDQEDILHRNAIRASGWVPQTQPERPSREIAFAPAKYKELQIRPASDPIRMKEPNQLKASDADRMTGWSYLQGKDDLLKPRDGPLAALQDLIAPLPVRVENDLSLGYAHCSFVDREKKRQISDALRFLQVQGATGKLITISKEEYDERLKERRKNYPPGTKFPYTLTVTVGGRPVVAFDQGDFEEGRAPVVYGQITPVAKLSEKPLLEKRSDEVRKLRRFRQEKSIFNATEVTPGVFSTRLFSAASSGTSSETLVETPVEAQPLATEESISSPPPVSAAVDSSKEKPLAQTSAPTPTLPALPEHITYLIIGAGTAAFAAVRSIKANDPTARVLLIGEEDRLPYMRPPLSKELWFRDNVTEAADDLRFKSWSGKTRSIFYEGEDYFIESKVLKEDLAANGVAVVTGHKVISLDANKQRVKLDTDQEISYNRCLIATGGHPITLPLFVNAPEEVQRKVTVFRNVEDFKCLEEVTRTKKTIGIVGGGFLGSELACALARRGQATGGRVVQIFPEKGNMGKVLPQYLTEWTTQKVRNEGVEVITNANVIDAKPHLGQVELTTSQGDKVMVDHVVVAVGLQPNTDLADSACLEVDPTIGGYRVNAELEARSNLWVAGDASSFFDVNLGRRRVEHHDHAVVSGRLAGENMTGSKRPYSHQSMFWSDLGPDVGYEAIGIVDSSLPTVAVWAKATAKDTPAAAEAAAAGDSPVRSDMEESAQLEPSKKQSKHIKVQDGNVPVDPESYGKGIIFYMQGKKVVGIVMWNVFGRMPVARKIISDGEDHDDLAKLAKRFRLHASEE